jgi:hypothetical protein
LKVGITIDHQPLQMVQILLRKRMELFAGQFVFRY